ncbi:TadE/TadG family type IV pilus assembly protein [Altererythrobacter sp. ZODW24]|uniref:TadE/TadG family type IV pilus assembly protein n=1 Tax=Altererythrobacter sp. ZODW24 TaxID=2185142 RepID=UPI000DF7AAA9|nr:TadE/TadG family type IV pilus assembly protein [Altererythrobacter sp. ZODW24]
MIRLLRSIRGDERGTTVMEFGLMITVFMTLLLGIFDIGQLAYTQAILNGAVQDAARTSSLETGDTSVADAKVQEMVALSAPGVTVGATRISYFDFADVDRPESWNDVDNSGDCNNGESYSDENGNGSWDEDIGVSGNGGAGDVVIYTVTATYDPLFPNPFITNGNLARTLKSSAVKKNQPFADQAGYGSDAGTC